jgi:hypothetical protein
LTVLPPVVLEFAPSLQTCDLRTRAQLAILCLQSQLASGAAAASHLQHSLVCIELVKWFKVTGARMHMHHIIC